jgi:amidase
MASGDELVRLTATQAVALLRQREITPLELIDAAAERIAAIDGEVNALPIRFFDAARRAARRLPAAAPRGDSHPGWLAGLPIVAKDYNDIAGQLTTYGSPIFANTIAKTTDITVATQRPSRPVPIRRLV